MEYTQTWIEMAAADIEALAVAIMVSFIASLPFDDCFTLAKSR